ncbi:hypothetical protein N7519_008115 [Penicillium mononematosum]|uniref:uncharacterized protein n=1 Tax=Penicillium mononematosum TaxID=268346 RepID=UPI002546D8DE|nr:uncharacterized protein N7519_008115 [Penicillium mononematosum]KAJ6177654.1 hypothetical protein N7519_008115 [Penicillium mononematosum]
MSDIHSQPPTTNIFKLSFAKPKVLLVTVDREKQRNALPAEAHWEAHGIFSWFDDEPTLFVAFVTGAGDKAFCAGQDLTEQVWERPGFFESAAISRSLDACLSASQLTGDDIDLYYFYSCFPIVPKLACHHLGISITQPNKPITLLGGLASFGGAGNNYSMHV